MTTTDKIDAQQLLQQIGRQTIAMLGLKNFLVDQSTGTVQMDVGRNPKGVTKIRITLDPSDTYTVRAYKGRGLNIKSGGWESDVYADGLESILGSFTGLATRLF